MVAASKPTRSMDERYIANGIFVPPLRLYMVKGSFIIADDGAAMDTEVWSRLPEELIWEVVRLVPAAAHFRWQLVSRNWREVLTSASFRNTLTAALASRASRPSWEEERQRQPPVVAGVVTGEVRVELPLSRRPRSSDLKCKVMEIDLTSLLPDWFWTCTSNKYTVETASDGLVCISNNNACYCLDPPKKMRYCVLNPLTRTYKVLPHIPNPFGKPGMGGPPDLFLQGTSTAHQVTIFNFKGERPSEPAMKAQVATYDLAGERVSQSAAYKYEGIMERPRLTLCAGDTYMYMFFEDDGQVRVLTPGSCGVEVTRLDKPSVALLGMDASPCRARWSLVGLLVAQRGTLFYMEDLCQICRSDVVMGVWRLARERLEWEPVARLDVAELELLTGVKCELNSDGALRAACNPLNRSGVRELLYFTINVWVGSVSRGFKLGLNLDTGEWEVVLDEDNTDNKPGPVNDCALLFELRQDVFLWLACRIRVDGLSM